MTVCERCYSIGYYYQRWNGDHYPRYLCDCKAARKVQSERRWKEPLGKRLYGYSLHKVKAVRYPGTGDYFWCDLGIEEDTRLLWAHGIETRWSCEGGTGSYRYFSLTRTEDVPDAMDLLPWAVRYDLSAPLAFYEKKML